MSPARKDTNQATSAPPESRTNRASKSPGQSNGGSPHEDVRRRAYELWEARGRAEGHELDDWCKAEDEVKRSGR